MVCGCLLLRNSHKGILFTVSREVKHEIGVYKRVSNRRGAGKLITK